MSTGWLHDGPLWDRQIAPREYLHVAGPMDDGRFLAVAAAPGRRAETRTATAAEGRQWADRQVTNGRVVPDELAARRRAREGREPDSGRTRGRSR
jgi:hypothetical protein